MADALVTFPADVDQPLGLSRELGHVDTVAAVHRDAAASGDVAHDVVARQRRAAFGKAHQHAWFALDHHAVADG